MYGVCVCGGVECICVCVEVLSAVHSEAVYTACMMQLPCVCGVHVGQQSLWHYGSVECHLHIPYKEVGLSCSLRLNHPAPGFWTMAMATRNSNHATPKAKDAT